MKLYMKVMYKQEYYKRQYPFKHRTNECYVHIC